MKKIIAILTILLSYASFAQAAEIIQVGTASSDHIVVVIESTDSEPILSQSPSAWSVNGANPIAVGRWSTPYDEGPGGGTSPVITMHHHFYLQLNATVVNGQTYQISTPLGNTTLQFNDETTFCESIKVNQVGYASQSNVRYANLGVFRGDLGPQSFATPPYYDVIDENSGQVVFSGQATYLGYDVSSDPNDLTSGEHIYRLDLVEVPDGGPYFVSVQGFGRSYSFGIGQDYSQELAFFHTRGMYHQRCGIALEEPYTQFTRDACHTTVEVTDAEPPGFIDEHGPSMEIHGGYHDAGDFDRRMSHILIPAWMLNIYDAFPENFTDNQYNIPESGNGVPDWLDEALWGLKVWEYLQDSDGGIRAGTEADRHPTYAQVNAATDFLTYRTFRKYGHTTAVGAGIFAHAARLLEPFDPARSQELLDRAVNAWNYLQSHDMPTAHESQRMYAALQLYLATGQQTYHDTFLTYANFILDGAPWPQQYYPRWFNLNVMRDGMVFTPYFFAYLITDMPADGTVQQGFIDLLESNANSINSNLASHPYPLGPAPSLAWGTGTNQGRYAEPSILMYRLTGDQQYYDAVSQLADYSVGLNPIGKSYVTGVGDNPPRSPLHLDSYFTETAGIGEVPGIVLYGPVAGPSGAPYQVHVWDKLYPDYEQMPPQRRYCDGWSFVGADEFTTWETMVLNVCMYGFLSGPAGGGNNDPDPNFAPTDISLSNSHVAENEPAGTLVGTLSTTDPNAGDTHTYSLVSGTGSADNGSFAISGQQLFTADTFDYEVKNSYSIRIQTSDGQGGVYQEVFTISVDDVVEDTPNQPPTDIALSNSHVAENEPAGTLVGTLSTTDPNAGDTHTYSLVSGTGSADNGSFAISGQQLYTADTFDYEVKNSYSIRIQTSDGQGGVYQEVFTISVDDVVEDTPNQPPTDIIITNNHVPENEPAGTQICQFQTSDPDPDDTHVYSLVNGTGSDHNSLFAIVSNQLQTAEMFDYEQLSELYIRVRTSDNAGAIFEKIFTILVDDVNEQQTAVHFAMSASSTPDEAAATHAVQVTLGLTGGTALAQEISLQVADTGNGTATSGLDYTPFNPQTITFPAGSPNGTTGTANISVLPDSEVEADETIVLQIVQAAGGTSIAQPAQHTVTIVDDDEANGGCTPASIELPFPANSMTFFTTPVELDNPQIRDVLAPGAPVYTRDCNGAYNYLPDTATLEPGRGYFVNNPYPQSFTRPFSGCEIDGPVTIDKCGSWNMILAGNPYPEAISPGQIVTEPAGMSYSVIAYYNGQFDYTPASIPAGAGIAVVTNADRIHIHRNGSAGTMALPGGDFTRASAASETNWQLTMEVTADENVRANCVLGVGQEFTDGLDSVSDLPEMLSPSTEFVRMSFPHDWYETDVALFNRDLRAPFDGEKVWEAQVEANTTADRITINWPTLPNIPTEWTFTLVDLTNDRQVDMRQEHSYTFRHTQRRYVEKIEMDAYWKAGTTPFVTYETPEAAAVYPFKIVVSKADERVAATPTSNEGQGTWEFRLDQNRPNPFSPRTTIAFQIPSWQHVSMKIYNISGQLVKTLHDGMMEAGPHEVSWDGTNSSGENVGAGVYFYRMQAGTFAQTRRMVLSR